jgi:hypothetical protein
MRFRLFLPLALTAAGSIYAATTPLSLRIGDEIQPPGGMVQMKLFLTEPKPISTGKGRMGISASLASSVEGVSLFSTSGDAAGAAVVHGTQVQMICIVPSTVLGSNPDFPLMAITSNVRSDAALGSSTTLSIKPSNLVLLDQNGVPYQEEIKSGSLTIANNVSITDVNPGSATVPAGGTVVISGLNFTQTTRVQIKEVNLASVTYISPTEMDVTVSAPVPMQGQQVTVQNPDGTSAVYYSFQRTTAAGRGSSPLFNATLPIFENRFWKSATFNLPADTATTYSGVAVQNLQSVSASIKVSLIASDGTTLGTRALSLATNNRLVRRMTDLISTPPPAGSHWLVQSNTPVQMLGLNGDTGAGTVAPVLPSATR